MSVSYTHLDVYKRQYSYSGTANNQEPMEYNLETHLAFMKKYLIE